MGLRKVEIGARVLVVDDVNKLLFTKGDIDKAKKRYVKEASKKLANMG